MPELSKEVVALLTYLLPGFLVAWIFFDLTTHQKPNQLERMIQALIFTLIVRAIVIVEKHVLLAVGAWVNLGPWNGDSYRALRRTTFDRNRCFVVVQAFEVKDCRR